MKCSWLSSLALVAISLPSTAGSSSSGTSNPFQQGCLFRKNLTQEVRMCNSEDPPEAVELGLCRVGEPVSAGGYKEIRIFPGNWESSMVGAWIVQILLSEMLNVPTSIETGDASLELNFYHPDSPFDSPVYEMESYFRAFENSVLYEGDCTLANANTQNGSYQECAHFDPETWDSRKKTAREYLEKGILETQHSVGMLGKEDWFVPKFTAEREPQVLHYLGLQGEENRLKLAQRFKRPTTWKDYCDVVSNDNCATPDAFAERPPHGEDEEDRMFVDGLYTGYFRATDKNNCTLSMLDDPLVNDYNNRSIHRRNGCSGFITDYPCSWRSPVPTQTYHLNIGLDNDIQETGGYSYSQIMEIWRAANATKSDVILYWWSPNDFSGEFLGTDAEFIPVDMPIPTQSCLKAKNSAALDQDHCSPDWNLRVNSPEAVCGDPPLILQKTMSTAVQDAAYRSNLPEASPSYTTLQNYQISEYQMNDIFLLNNKLNDPREAVCEWIAQNMDFIQGLVPATYPRSFEPKGDSGPLLYSSVIFGVLVVLLVLCALGVVYRQRDRRILQYAQIEFLVLLLVGCVLTGLGAIVIGLPSSNFTCVLEIWLVNIGYTLQLVPIIVKVAAVNQMMKVGRKMRRAKINRSFLYGIVLFVCMVVVVFLSLWTALDPPSELPEFQNSDMLNEQGGTIIWVIGVCGSESNTWSYISVGWNTVLLLCTSIYALQMRHNKMTGFNETAVLAVLVYSNFAFVVLRMITYLLASHIAESVLAHCRSYIFSMDVAMTIFIYFIPKFVAEDIDTTVQITGLRQTTGTYLPTITASPKAAQVGKNVDLEDCAPEELPAKIATDHDFALPENVEMTVEPVDSVGGARATVGIPQSREEGSSEQRVNPSGGPQHRFRKLVSGRLASSMASFPTNSSHSMRLANWIEYSERSSADLASPESDEIAVEPVESVDRAAVDIPGPKEEDSEQERESWGSRGGFRKLASLRNLGMPSMHFNLLDYSERTSDGLSEEREELNEEPSTSSDARGQESVSLLREKNRQLELDMQSQAEELLRLEAKIAQLSDGTILQ